MNDKNVDLNVESLEDRMMLSSVQIFASGDTGVESFDVNVNGESQATFTLYGTEQQVFSFDTSSQISGDDLQIEFTNDVFDPANGIDRNLNIDKVVIDGVTYETENAATFSTGTWKAEDGVMPGFRESETLNSNGFFQYSDAGASTPGTADGSVLTIRARGDEGGENFRLLINGQNEGVFSVSTEFQDFVIQLDSFITANDVRVEFVNDVFEPEAGIDRNLVVDFIDIDGRTFQTEDSSVFSTGSWLPEDGVEPGFGRSEVLNSNGYFQYSEQVEGSLITIRARGDEGGEQFRLFIGDVDRGTFTVTQQFQTFSFQADSSVSSSDVRIEFINDEFDPSRGVDANLVVDFITIDGVKFETEALSVFSTGTFTSADGIVPGFGRGETLNTNGFFQFGTNGPAPLDTDGDGKLDSVDQDDDNDGIADAQESSFGTNPLLADSDGDGVQDGTELGFTQGTPDSVGGNTSFQPDADPTTTTDPLSADTDGDGLTDGQEDPNLDGASPRSIGSTGTPGIGETDPTLADTDGDGLSDGQEVALGTNPLDTDTDDGSVADGVEVGQGTNPVNDPSDDVISDNDGDGRPDNIDTDDDNDGILDVDEAAFGTNPLNGDTDGDGLQDGKEIGLTTAGPDSTGGPISFSPDADPTTTTDPTNADTDGDGLTDGEEDSNLDGASPRTIGGTGTVGSGETDPNNSDTDGDGLTDGDELNQIGSNPLDTDTDDGTVTDGVEVGQGTNPVDNPSDDIIDNTDTDGDGRPDNVDTDDDNDGLNDDEEADLGTNPLLADSDGDGIQDGTELGRTTAPADSFGGPVSFRPDADPSTTTDPTNPDTDGDGLTDGQEDPNFDGASPRSIGGTGTTGTGETDPTNPDTDGDGLTDGEEVAAVGSNPLDTDTDDGTVGDGVEVGQGTNPVNDPSDDILADTDGDGRPDNVDTDDDNDGLTDLEEADLGTNPLLGDTDGDGLQDGTELGRTSAGPDSFGGPVSFRPDADPTTTTDPLTADSDGDGLTDGQEDPNFDGSSPRAIGGTGTTGSGETDPNIPDTDGDGLSDGDEVNLVGSNPLDTDTDDGTVDDGVEVGQGTDPVNTPGDDILTDTDGDGINDLLDNDDDNDGLLDTEEGPGGTGTDPLNADTDGDGLQDGTELGVTSAGPDSTGGPNPFIADADPTSTTDPLNADTDGDGLLDGEEDANGDGATVNTIGETGTAGSGETDPNNPDTDGDGLLDGNEVDNIGSSPLDTDTDDGGIEDGTEVLVDGTDPLVPGEIQRRKFQWDFLTEAQIDTINSPINQDVGGLTVSYTRSPNVGNHTAERTNTQINTAGIVSDGDVVDSDSSLRSRTFANGARGEFTLDFSDEVENVSFNIVDVDADSSIRVTAFDDAGNAVDIDFAIGSEVQQVDSNTVRSAEIGKNDELDPDATVNVSIDGPVSQVVIEHFSIGNDTSGVLVSDVYFDALINELEVGQPSGPSEVQAPNLGGNVFNGFIWDKNDISFTTSKNPFSSDVLGLSTSQVSGRTLVLNDGPVAIGVTDNDSTFGDSIKGGRITGFSETFVGGETLRVGDDFENEYSYLVREAGTGRLINLYAVETEGDVIGFASDAPMQQGVIYTFVSRTSTDPRVAWSQLANSFINFR